MVNIVFARTRERERDRQTDRQTDRGRERERAPKRNRNQPIKEQKGDFFRRKKVIFFKKKRRLLISTFEATKKAEWFSFFSVADSFMHPFFSHMMYNE